MTVSEMFLIGMLMLVSLILIIVVSAFGLSIWLINKASEQFNDPFKKGKSR